MPYAYSTLTSANSYVQRDELQNIVMSVTIKGGANLSSASGDGLVTPRGVATKITDAEADFLKEHPLFIEHEKNGFVMIDSADKDADKVAQGNLSDEDKAKPKTKKEAMEKK